jgi:hypothetical protein
MYVRHASCAIISLESFEFCLALMLDGFQVQQTSATEA